ncbi:aspartyl protease family protein [Mucilaginibacter sp. X5P1]|uniref:aspartyl protease family protein n=1 Tax=Mucilaginibacter sp. X5P1 TaxID=2723088 RepID=UPI00160BEE21|nr:aspartyl protease family protein [Mucilaginibacter sp. X5P1]MBB6139972.1 hypothetical protein [Mucilaginibacter sp. X5P1]
MKKNKKIIFIVVAVLCQAFGPLSIAKTLIHNKTIENRWIAEIHFETIDNLIYVPVSVNGSAYCRFILDGGSSVCVVDSSIVNSLHLTGSGDGIIHGAGTGAVKVSYCDSITYKLKDIKTLVPRSDIINLSNAVPGQKLDGLLGYDFFLKYVIEINYKNKVIRLYQPENYHYKGKGSVVPISFFKKIPHFRAKVKVPGRPLVEKDYAIDTGSSDVINENLLNVSTGPKKEVVGGVGVGQKFTIVQGKIETFQIGKYILHNLDGVSGADKIGAGLLSRYIVVFDYSRSHMILE